MISKEKEDSFEMQSKKTGQKSNFSVSAKIYRLLSLI